MALEVSADRAVCSRCGMAYGRRSAGFYVSYASLYRGSGYIPYCKQCLEKLYDTYLLACDDPKQAMRQMCRKLDLYWNDTVYEYAYNRSGSQQALVGKYITRTNASSYVGKSYDDTLKEEGTLWSLGRTTASNATLAVQESGTSESKEKNSGSDSIGEKTAEAIPDEVVSFWGAGYTPDMYRDLEARRKIWVSKFPEGTVFDIGTETIIRQICGLELDISRDRAAGRPVDKSVNALNTLLGSANMKPTQKKNDEADAELNTTPLGVWAWRWENNLPIPEPDDKAKENSIKKYIFTWMGHLSKLLGIKGVYTKLYDEEMARLRVEKPEYDDMGDEDVLIASYSEDDKNEDLQDGDSS